MKRIYGKVDLEGWITDTMKELALVMPERIRAIVAEIIDESMTSDEATIIFPVVNDGIGQDGFGNPAVTDPLTIYLWLQDLGEEGPAYEFNLRDAISRDIEICAEDSSGAAGLERLSKSLVAMSKEIDAAVRLGRKAAKKKGIIIGAE